MIEFLKNVELFRSFSDTELQTIEGLIERSDYIADSFLFKENTHRHNLFIIYSGEVELFKKVV